MTTVADKVQMQLTIPARAAAVGWLNAFLASSDDENRPALYRTLSLEAFPTGLHLVGCNGMALFRTWVPVEEGTWPGLNAQPERGVVLMDPDGFGLGFMRALLRVTSDEDHADELLTLTTAPVDDDATIALGAEFLTERVTLRACGQRIDLRVFDGHYPDWRKLRLGVEAIERVESLTIGTRVFGLLGKLKAVHAVDLEFYGDKKHVAFIARGESEVRGLLMPMMKRTEPVKE